MQHDILDVIGSVLTLVKLHETLYTTEEWDSLRIWTDTQTWYRFSKQRGGDVKGFIHYYSEIAGTEFDVDGIVVEKREKEKTIHVTDIHKLYGKKIYHPYLIKRGITEETANRFSLEYDNGFIYIPLLSLQDKRIGVQCRNVESLDKKFRYIFYLTVPQKPLLYPLNILKYSGDTILLCEGTFSSLRWNQVVNDTNYQLFATLGNNPSDELKRLLHSFKNIILFPDPDTAGELWEKKLLNLLKDKVHSIRINGKIDDLKDNELLYIYKYIKKRNN